MYTLLIYPGGSQVDALLLSASADRLRLVIRGRADTVELQRIDGRWVSESGVTVEVGALIANSAVCANLGRDQARPMVGVAG
jgi:hypothetical protein